MEIPTVTSLLSAMYLCNLKRNSDYFDVGTIPSILERFDQKLYAKKLSIFFVIILLQHIISLQRKHVSLLNFDTTPFDTRKAAVSTFEGNDATKYSAYIPRSHIIRVVIL